MCIGRGVEDPATVVIVAVLVVVIVVAVPIPDRGQPGFASTLSRPLRHRNPVLSLSSKPSSHESTAGRYHPSHLRRIMSQPIHTHTSDGVLHIETDQTRIYGGRLVLLWGHFANDKTQAISIHSDIQHKVDTTHHITMT